ncbi:hypothetical protein ADK35_16390, partial [Streptomyces viridochromogenes]
PLLIGANLLLAGLLLTLFTVDSPDRLWLLFAVLFLYGAAGVGPDAPESSLVASAVPAPLLGDFNGLRMTASEGMKLLPPLAGAGAYAAYGGHQPHRRGAESGDHDYGELEPGAAVAQDARNGQR